MTIAAETISRTYKCDWCEKEVTVERDIVKLPEKWVDSQGEPPISEHFCSGTCKWEANELWNEAFNVGMNSANDYFEVNRRRLLNSESEEVDHFKQELAEVRDKINFLVGELDAEMY